MLVKLLTFARSIAKPRPKNRLERWRLRNRELIGYVHGRQLELFGDEADEEADEDVISEEMLEDVIELDPDEYNISEMLTETFSDLDQLALFLNEMASSSPSTTTNSKHWSNCSRPIRFSRKTKC